VSADHYALLDWTPDDHVNIDFSVGDRTVFRHDGGHSVYFPPDTGGGFAPSDDRQGALRLVRHGRYVMGYYRLDGEWVPLATAAADAVDQRTSLGLFTRNDRLTHDVRVAFDNFRVNRGRLVCL